MSEDLLAYFRFKNANLSREDRRQILLANPSDYSLEVMRRPCVSASLTSMSRKRAGTGRPQPVEKEPRAAASGRGRAVDRGRAPRL